MGSIDESDLNRFSPDERAKDDTLRKQWDELQEMVATFHY